MAIVKGFIALLIVCSCVSACAIMPFDCEYETSESGSKHLVCRDKTEPPYGGPVKP